MVASPPISANYDAAAAWRARGQSVLEATQPPTCDSLAEALRLLTKSRGLFPLEGIESEVENLQRQLDVATVKAAQTQHNADRQQAPGAGWGPTPPPQQASAPSRQASAANSSSSSADGDTSDAEVSRVLGASDHYTALLIARGASAGEIRKAYHRGSRSVHPDKCRDGEPTLPVPPPSTYNKTPSASTANPFSGEPARFVPQAPPRPLHNKTPSARFQLRTPSQASPTDSS